LGTRYNLVGTLKVVDLTDMGDVQGINYTAINVNDISEFGTVYSV
jgi:hypothetical protein